MKNPTCTDNVAYITPIDGESEGYLFVPAFMHVTADITINVGATTYTLNPKDDLTAYELYNVQLWKEEVKANVDQFAHKRSYQFFIDRAEELNILRHFDIEGKE